MENNSWQKIPQEPGTPLLRLRVDIECDRDFAMFCCLISKLIIKLKDAFLKINKRNNDTICDLLRFINKLSEDIS